MKRKKKSFRSLYIILVMSIMGIAGVATIFMLFFNVFKSDNNIYIIENHKYMKAKIFKSINLKMANDPVEKDKYFLSRQGLNKLVKKIEEKIIYGPEIFALKEIKIGMTGILSKDVKGAYFPGTNQIFINTADEIRNGNFKSVLETETNDNSETVKIEMIMQVLFHEYNHHVAETYFGNSKINSINTTSEIYESNEKGDERFASYWNKNFIKEFKNVLGYNKSNQELKIGTNLSNQKNFKIWSKLKRINERVEGKSLYDHKMFFEYANSQNVLRPNLNEKDLIERVFFSGTTIPRMSEYKINRLDLKLLSYFYSMHEIYARKISQLSYLYQPNNKSILNNGFYVLPNNQKRASDMLFDSLIYKDDFENDSWRNYHMGDYVFEPQEKNNAQLAKNDRRSEKLYDLLLKVYGNDKGADLSIMIPFNGFTITNYNKSKNRHETIVNNNSSDASYIKIGGYIKKREIEHLFNQDFLKKNSSKTLEEKINDFEGQIAFQDNAGKLENVKKIKFFKFNVFRKENLRSTSPLPNDKIQDEYFWIINNGDSNQINETKFQYDKNDFIDSNQILNKKLFLTNDQKTKSVELKTTRDFAWGSINNQYQTHHDLFTKKMYFGLDDKQNAILKTGEDYG